MTGEVLYKNVLAMMTAYEKASGTNLMDEIIAHPEDWENEKMRKLRLFIRQR